MARHVKRFASRAEGLHAWLERFQCTTSAAGGGDCRRACCRAECWSSRIALAADKDWDGSASQDFNTAANWNIGGAATTVPTGVDNAFIQIGDGERHVVGVFASREFDAEQRRHLTTSGQRCWSMIDDLEREHGRAGAARVSTTGRPRLTSTRTFLRSLSGAHLDMAGGLVQIDREMTVGSGSSISGNGIIEMTSTHRGRRPGQQRHHFDRGGTLTLRQALDRDAPRSTWTATSGAGTSCVEWNAGDLVIDGP